MIRYRIFERLIAKDKWQPEGLVYQDEEGKCFYYHKGAPVFYPFQDLTQFGENHFPQEKETKFRWTAIEEWAKPEAFEPAKFLKSLRRSPAEIIILNATEVNAELTRLLAHVQELNQEQLHHFKKVFVDLYSVQESNEFRFFDSFFPSRLIQVLWRSWEANEEQPPLFTNPVHNTALLLYARAFGLPVDENPTQRRYLDQHNELFSAIMPDSAGWGARASLSKNTLVAIDSPVLHVFILYEADAPKKILIAGKGLQKFHDQIFHSALITAMRVQASDRDVFNDGLIVIEGQKNVNQTSDINLPAHGSNVPLEPAAKAEAAMREFIRQLRNLEQDTGFVQLHKADAGDEAQIHKFMRYLASDSTQSGEPILW
ncbi:hypothetical protein MJD09_00670, partial [bacterium]|nr:hypothetical protein [bacterium]